MALRRRSDWVNLYGAVVGSGILGWAAWEHAMRPGTDNHFTLSALVLGGVLIKPMAILGLLRGCVSNESHLMLTTVDAREAVLNVAGAMHWVRETQGANRGEVVDQMIRAPHLTPPQPRCAS